MTVSSYSLLDLPSAQSRMETLENLWKKTRKYFVLLEPGSNAGFEVLNEARDFLLQTYSDPDKYSEEENKAEKRKAEGHVFAPVIKIFLFSKQQRVKFNFQLPSSLVSTRFHLPKIRH